MKPEIQPSAQPTMEQQPVQMPIGPEAVPSLPPVEVQRGQEAFEQRAQMAGTPSPAPQMVQQPVMPNVPAPADPVMNTAVAAPIVAADEDLIEKEWVDKAKQIVRQTSNDPHARSEQVSELQRSYLQKRYGKVVGADS